MKVRNHAMANRLRRLSCALIALVLLIAVVPAASAAGMGAYFHSNAKVYQKPSTSSASLSVPKGTPVVITGMNGGWAQVYRDGVTAYCPTSSLLFTSRIKGYTNQTTKIYAAPSKSSASATLGLNTEVYIIGIGNGYFCIQNANASITGFVLTSTLSPQKTTVSAPSGGSSSDPRSKVVALDWFNGGSDVLKRGQYGQIYDIASGVTINVYRMGGSSHADLEPVTAEDAAKLKSICGGSYSWDSRPVILIANGVYAASAINTMPHGDQTITNNNYDGQFCLHMINSKTHGSDSVNTEHQKAIQAAYAWAHS